MSRIITGQGEFVSENLFYDGKQFYHVAVTPTVVSGLSYKERSRCFIFNEEDVIKVEEILKEIDEGEFSYMPSRNDIISISGEDYTRAGEEAHWITLYKGDDKDFVYTGKFQPNLELLYKACYEKGIKILIVDKYNYNEQL